MPLDPQAAQLNEWIAADCPALPDMLSRRGRAIYFPKLGILAQSAEAQGKSINATIGIALEEDGSPMRLPTLAGMFGLPPDKVFPYAPSPGRPELRKAWRELLLRKNPSLAGKPISLPVVTCALTHGLSMAGYLFCDPGDRVVSPDLYWENYDLIFGRAYGAKLDFFPMFAGPAQAGGFNAAGLRAKLAAGRKAIVLLNFPNNPTGYSPTRGEVDEICASLRKAAEQGARLVVVVDDAYFGLVYEPDVFPESVFARLCDLHENLLAVKLDGATKEDYVWGFRVGFVTYGIRGGTARVYEALEAKTAGAVRGNVSNASNPAQSMLAAAYGSPGYDGEKLAKYEALRARYRRVKEILAAHPEYRREFEPMPFNSGYFMCLRLARTNPESLRRKLLDEYSTGVIVMSGLVRLAFSATPPDKLETLFDNIYRAACSM